MGTKAARPFVQIEATYSLRRRIDSADIAGELNLDYSADHQFRGILSRHHVRASHCTRLMAHEVEAIRREGLTEPPRR